MTSIDTASRVVGRHSQQPFRHAPGMAAMRLLLRRCLIVMLANLPDWLRVTIAAQSLSCAR